MASTHFSDSSQHQQELGMPSLESLIEGYHSRLLTLYQPVWSCPWPRETDPVLGTVGGLDIHELSLWQEAISTLVGETLVLQKLAGELMVEGRQGEALAIYRQLVDADPENPQVLHNLAGAYLLCGNATEAERTWRQIMTLDPTWEEPRLALAQALLDRQFRDSLLQRSPRCRIRPGAASSSETPAPEGYPCLTPQTEVPR